MRPEAHAGPIDLKLIPLKSDDDTAGLIWLSDPFASYVIPSSVPTGYMNPQASAKKLL